tara:strand:- start:1387 stop:1806 length:420 start_codon:yes stop_codon:yes gene_type:complete
MKLFAQLLVIAGNLSVWCACGIVEGPQYVKYEGPDIKNVPLCDSGIAGFEINFNPIVKDSCLSSSCHAAGGSGYGKLALGEDAAENRTAIKNNKQWTGAVGFFDYISGNSGSHTGQGVVKTSFLEALQAWEDTETDCAD